MRKIRDMEFSSMATEANGTDSSRLHQTFPVLSDTEIARIARFGSVQQFARGTRLFTAGETAPGMFVLLKGIVTVTQRDGLGHVVPVVRQGPGSSWPKSASCRAPRAGRRPCRRRRGSAARLARPAARAAGGRSRPGRAHHARADPAARGADRVRRQRAGADRPPQSPDMVRLENFLRRNGYPYHVVDANEDPDAAALLAQYGAGGDLLAVCPDGSVLVNPSDDGLARCLGMVDTAERDELFDVAVVGAGPAGLATACMRPRKACA
jgi:thioredoxin reductase (NADPH)